MSKVSFFSCIFQDFFWYAQVWTKQLARPAHGSVAIATLGGMGGSKLYMPYTLAKWGLTNANGYNVINAWDNKPLGKFGLNQQFNLTVTPMSIDIWIATPL